MHQPKLGNMNANVCKCCGVLASVARLPLIKTDQHNTRTGLHVIIIIAYFVINI